MEENENCPKLKKLVLYVVSNFTARGLLLKKKNCVSDVNILKLYKMPIKYNENNIF